MPAYTNVSPDAESIADSYAPPRGNGGLSISAMFYPVIYVYLIFSFGFNAVVLIPFDSTVGGDKNNGIFSISWIAMHGLVLAYFFLQIFNRRFFRLGISEFILIFFAFYVTLSITWTPDPVKSSPYALMMAGNALFAYLVSRTVSPREFLIIIRNVILGMILLSLVAWLCGYQNVIYYDPHDRSNIVGLVPLRGFFPHKIMASLYAVLGVILAWYSLSGFQKAFFISVSIIFTVLTGSSTGLVLMLLAFLLFPALSLVQRARLPGPAFALIMIVLMIPSIGVSYGYYADVLEVLGRDPTLTGRTLLWSWGMETWLSKPLTGWGFKGYFDSVDAKNFGGFYQFKNYDVPHFHQSFIQTAVDLGVIGLGALVGNIILLCAKSYSSITKYRSTVGRCIIAMTMILLTASLSMFLFYNYNHPATIILLYFLFYLSVARNTVDEAF